MNNILTRKRKGLSPILATVILIGITVAAGGAVYAIWTGSSAQASSSNVIRVDSLTAVKGSNHADFAITVTNGGSTPWKAIEVWVSKEATSKPILYEELHEMAQGEDQTGNTDNPLRAEAVGTLSDGFGVGIGRKFVLKIDEDPSSTAGAPATRTVAIEVPAADFSVGTDLLNKLDSKWKGTTNCEPDMIDAQGDGSDLRPGCVVRTTKALTEPIGAGKSMRFYADLILSNTLSVATESGLQGRINEQLDPAFVTVGDELVVNVRTIGINNEEAQIQTVVQVTGV